MGETIHEDQDASTHAVIYARVSTDDQVQGTSIETQIEACQHYARMNHLVVWQSHIFIDGGVSGAVLERPALDRMRAVIRAQTVQAVIVFALDRLSSILWHQSMLIDEWEKAGVRFHTVREKVEDSPEGQLMRQVVGSFAEWERAKIRDRMMRGKQRLIEKGFPQSHTAPYGYYWTKIPHASTLAVDEVEAEVVRRIFRWALEGRTTRWITMELTRERIPTRRATLKLGTNKTPPWHWNGSSVRRMLRSETYLGRIYAGQTKGGVHQPHDAWITLSIPAIIDQETFDAVGERLVINQAKAKRNAKHTYLLSAATLRCGLCGGGMSGASHSRQKVGAYDYYLCNTHVKRMDRSHCRVFVPARVIEPSVWAFVEQICSDPKTILEALVCARQGGAEQRMEAQRLVDRAEQRIIQNAQEDDRLIEAYQGGAMTVEELKSRRQRVATEKQDLLEARWEAQEALNRLGAPPPRLYEIEAYLNFVRQHLTQDSLDRRRWIIEQLRLVVTWTPGEQIKVHGSVPSTIPDAWCDYEMMLDMPAPRRRVLADRIQTMREGERLTHEQIADTLQAEGVPTISGWGQWGKSTVQRIYWRHCGQPARVDMAPVLARVTQLRDEEHHSWRRIAEILNAEGLPTRSGQGQWYLASVQRLYTSRPAA